MTAAELGEVLSDLGAVEVRSIARVPAGWMVQVGVVAAAPPHAVELSGYEPTDGVYLRNGEFAPTAGYRTVSHAWVERVGDQTVQIRTEPVPAGPVERWRAA